VNGHPGDKETPLITAACYGDAEVAQVLIEAGADIDALSAPDSGGARDGPALRLVLLPRMKHSQPRHPSPWQPA
jgi:uncharacterized protein